MIKNIFVAISILILIISIILAYKFKRKQNKRYREIKNMLNKNKNATFEIKEGISKEEISLIDSNVDIEILMKDLYNTYLTFETKLRNLDENFDDILDDDFKTFNIYKVKNFKEKGIADIIDNIDLVSYAIINYTTTELTFRVVINCLSYKMLNNEIVSGSNLNKVQKILLITYKKINDKWLISSYDEIYEKKLSE